jgi:hypothetical protein
MRGGPICFRIKSATELCYDRRCGAMTAALINAVWLVEAALHGHQIRLLPFGNQLLLHLLLIDVQLLSCVP